MQSLFISTKVLEFRDKKDFCLVLCIQCDQVVVVWEVIDVLVYHMVLHAIMDGVCYYQ
jgi:hypothetical protein